LLGVANAIVVYNAASYCLTLAYKLNKIYYYILKFKKMASCISSEYRYIYAAFYFQM